MVTGSRRRRRRALEVRRRLRRTVHRLVHLTTVGEEWDQAGWDVEFGQQPLGDRVSLEHLVEALFADGDVAEIGLGGGDHQLVPEPLPGGQLLGVRGTGAGEVAQLAAGGADRGQGLCRQRVETGLASGQLRLPADPFRLGPLAEHPERRRAGHQDPGEQIRLAQLAGDRLGLGDRRPSSGRRHRAGCASPRGSTAPRRGPDDRPPVVPTRRTPR